jgi:outer membrane protein
MMNMKKFVVVPALLFASASLTAVAHAQDEDESKWGGNIILGAGVKPDYEGSEDYEATPLAAGKLEYGQYYLEAHGTNLRANVSPLSNIEFGPSISFEGGRDDVDNERVNRMRDIDDTVEAGAFVKIPLRQVFDDKDEFEFGVEFLADTGDAHEGYKVKLGLSYKYLLTEKLRLGANLSTTYASDDYNQTYFGIDADNSARSGLSQYEADAGFKDVGVGVSALYRVNENWGVTGIAQYKQLIGDAADSPIVDQEGSAGQAMVGVGILYRF